MFFPNRGVTREGDESGLASNMLGWGGGRGGGGRGEQAGVEHVTEGVLSDMGVEDVERGSGRRGKVVVLCSWMMREKGMKGGAA
jgi:hypothetical protein